MIWLAQLKLYEVESDSSPEITNITSDQKNDSVFEFIGECGAHECTSHDFESKEN